MTAPGRLTDEARRADILALLRRVIDPELGLDIVALGLVYEVVFEDDNVTVDMTLTTRGCPMQGPIIEGVRRVLGEVTWLDTARVRLVWDPPWTPDRIQR
ncbi:MAG TPA: metal-sulfur cluster assembly factor [Gemmatimonadales bacterium]|nr:metal-sulfur cluster assembly factor [Gemmatimonadales bacterium]